MRLFLLFMFVAVAVASRITVGNHALDNAWTQFKTKYNKKYDLSEESSRRIVWESNLAFIEKHNQEAAQGKHKYTLAVNKFADMTNEEFNKAMNKYKPSSVTKSHVQVDDDGDFQDVLPAEIDWRGRNIVSDVRGYGYDDFCGISWITSALGSVEGQHAKVTGNLVSLSAQQIMDCDMEGEACEGGQMESTFEYILNSDGIQDEDTYRSTGYPDKCKFDSRQIAASIKGYAQLKSGSERELQRATAAIGPISVAVDASPGRFQYYYGGVFDGEYCSPTNVNHGILVVGYGTTDDGTDYWILKNSWGYDWGEKGYMRLVRNGNNTCGIATRPSYPIVY